METTFKVIDSKFYNIIDDVDTDSLVYDERNKCFVGDVRIVVKHDNSDDAFRKYATQTHTGTFTYKDFADDYGFILWHDSMVSILSPRICDVTGQQMWAGYVYADGEMCFKYENDLIPYLRAAYASGFYGENMVEDAAFADDDSLLGAAYDDELYYYTWWEELGETGYTPEGWEVEL